MNGGSSFTLLPNLPGYRINPRNNKSPKKSHAFQHIDGLIFLKETSNLPQVGSNTIFTPPDLRFSPKHDIMRLGPGGTTSLSSRPHSRPNTQSPFYHVESANVTLTFIASFSQISPNGMLDDGNRKRKANIYFYTEDGTLTIVERPQVYFLFLITNRYYLNLNILLT